MAVLEERVVGASQHGSGEDVNIRRIRAKGGLSRAIQDHQACVSVLST